MAERQVGTQHGSTELSTHARRGVSPLGLFAFVPPPSGVTETDPFPSDRIQRRQHIYSDIRWGSLHGELLSAPQRVPLRQELPF